MITVESIYDNNNGIQVEYVSHNGMKDAIVFPYEVWSDLIEYVAVEIELRTKPACMLPEADYLERKAAEGILPEDL